MPITTRQKRILALITEEYVSSARPAGSRLLAEKYQLGISPAMIRVEMQALTREGYLEQPYPSAGRIPSSKAYRFLITEILEDGKDAMDKKLVKEIEGVASDVFQLLKTLTRNLARASSNLALAYLVERDFCWKEGWDEVLQNSEFRDFDFTASFCKMVKRLEESAKGKKRVLAVAPRVYIGRENPLFPSDDFGLIITHCSFPPDGEEGGLAILGPKRMNYDRNIKLIKALAELFHD